MFICIVSVIFCLYAIMNINHISLLTLVIFIYCYACLLASLQYIFGTNDCFSLNFWVAMGKISGELVCLYVKHEKFSELPSNIVF